MFQVELLASHIRILNESIEVIKSLNNSEYSQQLRNLENRYIKSLICEITKVLHFMGCPLVNPSSNTIQLCPVYGRYGIYQQTYFFLGRLRRLVVTLHEQYSFMTIEDLVQYLPS